MFSGSYLLDGGGTTAVEGGEGDRFDVIEWYEVVRFGGEGVRVGGTKPAGRGMPDHRGSRCWPA